ncbi:MAG: divergent polysaccharide deacetylase family protein [Veillonellales bacterium]
MKKGGRQVYWLAAVLVLLLIGLYFHFSHKGEPEDVSNQRPKYSLEKTGAGAVADFTAVSQQIHSAVDGALNQSGWVVRDAKAAKRETPRQQVEGTIRWHTRQLLLDIPAGMTVEQVRQIIASSTGNAGGEILAAQPDKYLGVSVTRIDVGIRDQLGGDPITIITDKLYIHQDKTPVTKEKSAVTLRGQMAIIVDDFGYSSEPISAFAGINRPLTWAILPYRPYSNEAAARGIGSGHQVMLHLPMEPLSAAAQSEEVTIGVNMSDQEIRDIVSRAVRSVPGIVGVNNHQGSRATADSRVMQNVFAVLKANHLFFVDSRTSSQSIAYDLARQSGLRAGENQLFIDNSSEVSAIKKQLRSAGDIAIRSGAVTVIGHARMNTATAVREMIPELEAEGIELVFVAELLK